MGYNKRDTDSSEFSILEPAGFWWRFFAHIIDLTIFVIIIWLLFNISVRVFGYSDFKWMKELGLTSLPTNYLIISTLLILLLPFGFLYFFLFELSTLKATPGKIIMGLYIVSSDGTAASASKIFKRTIARLLCILSFGLGYCLAGFTSKRKALHDFIADTTVVNYGGIPLNLRFFSALSSIIIFTVTLYLLPAMKLPKLIRSSIDNSFDYETLEPNSVQEHNERNYLQFENNKTEIQSTHAKLDRIQLQEINNQVTTPYQRVTIAYFSDSLNSEDKKKLIYSNNYFDDAENRIGKAAILTTTILFNDPIQGCDNNKIRQVKLDINPKKFSLSSNKIDYTANLDISSLIAQNDFKITCESLQPFQNVDLDFSFNFQTSQFSSQMFLNFKDKVILNTAIVAKDYKLSQMGSAVAFWKPIQEKLIVYLYADILNDSDLKTLMQTSNTEVLAIKPAIIINYNYPENSTVFVRDLVKTHTITFYKQNSGALSKAISNDSIMFEYGQDELPHSLNGKMISGQRLIGRIQGQKEMNSKDGDYNFKWDIPFNATVIVKE
jgi:uncharacterized RDD family membrane protein YckC